MVKVEGTLEEMYELFGDARQMVKSAKKTVRSAKKVASKVKRPLNSWQKYVKANSNKFKYKSGTKKGQINLKAMSRAFKKTRKGKK
jgi:DNA polymerase elongation subunit (family B)